MNGESSTVFGADSLRAGMHAFSEPDLAIAPARLVLLCVVLAALVGFAWWASRRNGGTRLRGMSGLRVRVVQRVPVGRKQALLLVDVDGRRILVGSTPNSLTAISEWDDEERADERDPTPSPRVAVSRPAATRPGAGRPVATSFDDVLARLRAVEDPS